MNKPGSSSTLTLERLPHDILNRLTVIHLCSCELRNAIDANLEPDQLKGFERLEGAVSEAAEMIRQLRANVQDQPHPTELHSGFNRLETAIKLSPLLSRLVLP